MVRCAVRNSWLVLLIGVTPMGLQHQHQHRQNGKIGRKIGKKITLDEDHIGFKIREERNDFQLP